MKVRYIITVIMSLAGIVLPSLSTVEAQNQYWYQKKSLFDRLKVTENDIVFLGNSITDGGEFAELFGMDNVLNRGISADNISGVRKRLYQVTDGKPKKIFLLIGINDIANGYSAEKLATEYEKLVKEIREQSPNSELYIQSIFPFNNDFKRYKTLYGKEQIWKNSNIKIKEIAERNGATFIDLTEVFADPATGKLRKDYTNDGLHLLGPAYRAWVDAIRKYVVTE